jgi:hypothetical protein
MGLGYYSEAFDKKPARIVGSSDLAAQHYCFRVGSLGHDYTYRSCGPRHVRPENSSQ